MKAKNAYEKPASKSYGFFAGENDEIELVFLTKSIGKG